ncbi:MAG: hypothetical protein GTO55_11030, partial [Armatimonadetes bacterium]|nr:hypothetical protein [Armatimonadota bacterium]NIM24757.1 hypothetical protein [Armatimonadota bacterium]NIM68643.1 hypothetical protein [Armatimonadota bacterium]NIO98619.1 hypothetical protein [Armatimonadota bacterium]NIT32141.1 hypothetical protein [Armatimonadota bacterium]
ILEAPEATEIPHESAQGIGEVKGLKPAESLKATETGSADMSELIVLAPFLRVF